MAGAEVLKYLRDLVTSVCCIAKRGGDCEAPVFVQNCTDTAEPTAGAAISLRPAVTNPTILAGATPGEYTSYEVENFHPTFWLYVEGLVTAGNPTVNFLVPPNGSKVIAFSNASITNTPTDFTFYASIAAVGVTPVDAGTFDGSEWFQTTLISAG